MEYFSPSLDTRVGPVNYWWSQLNSTFNSDCSQCLALVVTDYQGVVTSELTSI